jgi:hypothetical protein
VDKLVREINYDRSSPPFEFLAEAIEAENQLVVDAKYGPEIDLLRFGLNYLYSIASEFAWVMNAPHIAIQSRAPSVLFSTLHKNLIALHTSLKLTRIGLHGPARSILRHVYEALLIAKFCSLSDDPTLYERWKEGDSLYLTNGVLKKISFPDTEPFREFWSLLSSYTHATIYAQQIALNVKSTPNEVPLNLVYLRILLDCQSHLLSRHLITPSMQYYTKRYRSGPDPLPELRAELKRLLIESRSTLLEQPRQIIRNYRASWELLPVRKDSKGAI